LLVVSHSIPKVLGHINKFFYFFYHLDLFQKVTFEQEFFIKVFDFYKKIVNNPHNGKNLEKLKGTEIWRNFKAAYDEDMKVCATTKFYLRQNYIKLGGCE